MSRLTVPKTAYPFLAFLTVRSPEELRKTAAVLQAIGIDFSFSKFQFALVAEKLFEDSDAELFLTELTHIYRSKQSLSLSGEEWYNELLDALGEESDREWKTEHLDAIKSRKAEFVELLTLNNFDTVTKAKHLAIEHERILLHSRIITDIRPVFREEYADGESTSTHIDASVITSMLKLVYSDPITARSHEFFVHLDEEDVARLRILCERELVKIRTIQDSLKDLNWNIYRPRSTFESDLESKPIADSNEIKGES